MAKSILCIAIICAICYCNVLVVARRAGSSAACTRTNKKPWKYCETSCSADSDCPSKKTCLCDGDCGMSCVKRGLSCGNPPSVSNGRRKVSGTRLGGTVTYKCNKNYHRRGPEKRVCRAIGKWDGRNTRCRRLCKDPGDTKYGNRDKGSANAFHRVGTRISYWCFRHAQMQGSATIVCQKNGEWNADRPNCTLPTCTKPVMPANAVFLKPSMAKSRYNFNDIVLYKCEYGYYGVGVRLQTCLGGAWEKTRFRCLPKSCGDPGNPTDGKRIGTVFTFKSKVFFTCSRGHLLIGSAFRQCQSNQQWSGNIPTCPPVDCGRLPVPQHGVKTEETKTTYQGKVSFKCIKKGYELKGAQVRICQENGKWDGTLTKCQPVECDDPGKPRYGGRIPDKNTYIYDDKVRFECKQNFTRTGDEFIVCRENKAWTGTVPVCLAPCPDPGTPTGGSRWDHDFRHGKQVRFQCQRNWELEGTSIIRCNNGNWDHTAPKCLAPCARPGRPVNGWVRGWDFRHRKSITFGCNRDFRRIGVNTLTCNNGIWSSAFPTCKPVCRHPGTLANGYLHGRDFLEGKQIRFSCRSGYDLIGVDRLTCVAGKWDGRRPECKRRCRVPNTPSNGQLVQNYRPRDSARHGVRLSYRCMVGTDMVGSPDIECIDGSWRGNVPSCKARCGNPGAFANGRQQGNDFRHQGIVTYQCYRDFSLSGPARITCQDGRWTPNPPTCKRNCPNPGTPANGIKVGSDYRHGNQVTFSCSRGFGLRGSKSIVCNAGRWNDTMPTCRGVCTDLPSPKNGRRIGHSFDHGAVVFFDCNPGYTRRGPQSLTCRSNGTWDHKAPVCKGSCSDPGDPINGFRHGNDFGHGAVVNFTCAHGFKLIGPSKMHCTDGVWTSDRPLCQACGSALGMESGAIADDRITSSTKRDWYRRASKGRLNGNAAWCSGTDRSPYLQIDFGKPLKITALATQGSAADRKWVSWFVVGSNLAGSSYVSYRENQREKLFEGNTDDSSVKKHPLQNPFIARRIRLLPLQRNGFTSRAPACMRVEVYGCDLPSSCIMVGSRVYGKWGRNPGNADYYYRAYVRNIDPGFVEVDIETQSRYRQSYQKFNRNAAPSFVLDVVPKPTDLSVRTRVIAKWGDRYYSGTITVISGRNIRVRYDDGDQQTLSIEHIRLLRVPSFC